MHAVAQVLPTQASVQVVTWWWAEPSAQELNLTEHCGVLRQGFLMDVGYTRLDPRPFFSVTLHQLDGLAAIALGLMPCVS